MLTVDHLKAINFHEELESQIGNKLHLKINDNRSTMLSVKWEPYCTKVSVHRMFLQAPRNVMHELATYLRQKRRPLPTGLKAYIENNLHKLDYSSQLDLDKLTPQGRVYDLQQIYEELNEIYFNNKLKLYITWFGKPFRSTSSRFTFGLYHDPLKLIKINKLLDSHNFPPYLVYFIVYHEMVHHVCPSYVDDRGIKHIHSKEFKEQEKKFQYFDLAEKWIKNNQKYFFNFCR